MDWMDRVDARNRAGDRRVASGEARALRSAILVALLALGVSLAGARDAAPPPLPPGVSVVEVPRADYLPPGVIPYALRVDWREPRLKARVVEGTSPDGSRPQSWDRLVGDRLGIQLAEPVSDDAGVWSSALESVAPNPAEADGTSGASARTAKGRGAPGATIRFLTDLPITPASRPAGDHFRIGGIVPWIADGPTPRADAEPVSPLSHGAARVAVRWAGRASDWRSRPPAEPLRSLMLLSAFDPYDGTSTFVLLANNTPERVESELFADWLDAAFAPEAWIAIHSLGAMANAGMGDWRMTGADFTRPNFVANVERAGTVLLLEARATGDEIDWARLPGARMTSSAPDFAAAPEPPDFGPPWPALFRSAAIASGTPGEPPPVESGWVDPRAGGRRDGPTWLELEFEPPRRIRTIRLLHASALGLPRSLAPPAVRFVLSRAGELGPDAPIEVDRPEGDATAVRLPRDEDLSRVRVEFDVPASGGVAGGSFRIGGLQCLGPWDGISGAPKEPPGGIRARGGR